MIVIVLIRLKPWVSFRPTLIVILLAYKCPRVLIQIRLLGDDSKKAKLLALKWPTNSGLI